MVDSITGLLLYRNLPRRRDGGYRRYHRYTGTRQMRGYDRGGEESVRRSTGASKCGYGHRTGKSAPKVKKKQIVETELDKFLN